MQQTQGTTSVSLTRLRLKFPGEESLLFKDLSLDVSVGQKVLLLGPSGCGKSTLLQVLSGIIPQSLEVPLKYEDRQLPRHWGYVFQDPDTQFCMPYVDEELAFVLENLSIPREQMPARMQAILERVGLHFTDLHTPIQSLSQGMKQRLALASVLLLEPEVLFLDEPSALLDPEGTEQVWDTVKDIAGACTILIVEHKIEHVIDVVDRVLLFDNEGHIMADGRPEEIFTAHKNKLIDYGIWYPGVWQDYADSESYQTIVRSRQSELREQREQRELREQREQTHEAAMLETRPTASITEDATELFTKKPILSLQDFAGYREQEIKVCVPKAEVYPGEWIAIVGENGAGKSTLLLSLMQLLSTTGKYIIAGRLVPKAKKRWFGTSNPQPPAELAFVFQNPEMQFLTNSVYEELAYELRLMERTDTEIEQQVTRMLNAFELDSVGLQRHPYHLSLGQKRRLSVASAMMRERPVLLLDEPTFGQDARNTFAILDKLERLRAAGTAIIMVTHDQHIVQHFADRVWQVEHGRLTESVWSAEHASASVSATRTTTATAIRTETETGTGTGTGAGTATATATRPRPRTETAAKAEAETVAGNGIGTFIQTGADSKGGVQSVLPSKQEAPCT
ncbi:ABC transporter ATP-binding protein [Paenibacillus sp. 481]|uniref:ABC transporter ATP-binding protein n=1 Tax=Paenibacillus sp. 481 TaxID=2835869 RepID=UPI001E37B43D|nr:ABC transporter ATP-binding protein [Paenibacillus sp. 481]UHA74971.1 ABC transporter ATP-binding protein [Paenibacillus sp. 481]